MRYTGGERHYDIEWRNEERLAGYCGWIILFGSGNELIKLECSVKKSSAESEADDSKV